MGRTFTLAKPVNLGPMTMDAALDMCLSNNTLRQVYGADIRVSPWTHDHTRTFEFSLPLSGLPPALAAAIGCDCVLVTTTQRIIKTSPREWVVQNTPAMSFPLSHMLVVKPTFTLEQKNTDVVVSARIEHVAYMLPPLNWMLEAEMERRTRLQMDTYFGVIGAKRAVERGE